MLSMFCITLLQLSVGPILYLVFTTSLSNFGYVRSNLIFTLSNLGSVRSIHLMILSAGSETVLISDLWSDEKAEAWE